MLSLFSDPFYIIRAHEEEYTLLNDMDDVSDTVTIRTDKFSDYATAYQQMSALDAQGGSGKCGMCHICSTFLGICWFIWLAVITAAILAAVLIVLRRKKEEEKSGL